MIFATIPLLPKMLFARIQLYKRPSIEQRNASFTGLEVDHPSYYTSHIRFNLYDYCHLSKFKIDSRISAGKTSVLAMLFEGLGDPIDRSHS
jgi:hypothetical protein